MNLSPATAPIDFSLLNATSFIHTADWEAIELRAKQANYGRLYQTYNRVLAMNEEGTHAIITVKSVSDTLIIDDRNEDYFNLMDYVQDLGNRLHTLAKEILALQEKQQKEGLNNDEGEAVNERRRLALALCLPVPMGTAALLTSDKSTHRMASASAA